MGLVDVHHIRFIVANAKQSAYWYCCCFGFRRFAEKRTTEEVCVAVRNGKIVFVFSSSLSPSSPSFNHFTTTHGDAVGDVAFLVDDVEEMQTALLQSGSSTSPISEEEDEHGSARTMQTRADTSDLTHTLIQLVDYRGVFLPGYETIEETEFIQRLPPIPMSVIDHCVQNYPEGSIESAEVFYERTLGLQRFWSVDDRRAAEGFSGLRSRLLVNPSHAVQMTLIDPVKGWKRNQCHDFLEYNGGAGIQHIALRVEDIIGVVGECKQRSVEFLSVPDSYYDALEERLAAAGVEVKEDLEKLRELRILVDFDQGGYLLQIFTQPVQDRACMFVELIQRRNFNGFGAGNFKALVDAVERELEKKREGRGRDENGDE